MSQYERDQDEGGAALAPERPKLQPPRQYAVVLVNDDFTPMDFVVAILTQVFTLSADDATRIMLDVHEKGRGVAGTYTREIAETKIAIAHNAAQQAEHPLRCELAPA